MTSAASQFQCRMDSLACALRAAVKVAGKDHLAYVRLHRLNEDTLAISALGPHASFRVKLKVEFLSWEEDRDHRVEISKHAAASLAGYQVKTPDGLDVEPLVTVQIGEERIRVEDATGLFQTAGGRDEHRLADSVLPGDHEKIFVDAAISPSSSFWIGPEELTQIAGVAKVLCRRIVMWRRAEPEEFASRWYVLGDDWQMTVSRIEKHLQPQPEEPDAAPTYDDTDAPDDSTERPNLVLAVPTGGLA